VTVEEAEELLSRDLAVAARAVEEHVRVPLNANQFSALASFAFNVGGENFRTSTLCRRLNAGEYDAVPGELTRWVKAKDPKSGMMRTLPGLVRRRAAEAGLWGEEGAGRE
jgi:lysozyme